MIRSGPDASILCGAGCKEGHRARASQELTSGPSLLCVNGQSAIKERNGSNDVIKQHAWGLGLVDEAARQTATPRLAASPFRSSKRNLGSACRARTPTGRKKDMLLRAITHNVMILANL